MGKVLLEVHGYINPFRIDIGCDMSEDELRNFKIDIYEVLMNDLKNRIDCCAGIQTWDWDDIEGYLDEDENDFFDYVTKRAGEQLSADGYLKLNKVNLVTYFEHGKECGFDYIAFIDVDLNEWYKDWAANK